MKGSFYKYLEFFILAFLLFMLERSEMYMRFGYEESSFPYQNYIIIAMLIISVFYFIKHNKYLIHTKLLYLFAATIISIYFFTVIWSLINPLHSKSVYGYLILPLFMFMYISGVTRKTDKVEIIVYTMYAIAVALAVYFFMNYYNGVYDIEQRSNTSYTVLYFLPMMLCTPKKLLRYAAIALVVLVVMYSLKRGGFIAIIIGLAVYFYISQVKIGGKQLKLWSWIVFFVVATGGYWAITRINNVLLDDMLFSRMSVIEETGGAGRESIYRNVIELIGSDGIVKFLFGHGWRTTANYTYMHLTAHNDFLEIIFDFGIIAFVFYIALIVQLFNVAKKLVKKKSEYAPAFCTSIAIFIVNSMVSHIMIYCQYLLIFAVFWGLINGIYLKRYQVNK